MWNTGGRLAELGNMGSANTGELSWAFGNSYNLLKPQFPPLSRQVIMPTSRDYGKDEVRCYM